MPVTVKGQRRRKLKGAKGKVVKVSKTVKPATLSDPVKAGVLAVVRRMISKKAENKLIGNLVEDEVLHNSAIGAADCEPIIPEIAPLDAAGGSTARQRVGDRITPKYLKVRGVVSLNQSSPPTGRADLYARVIIAAQKDVKTGAAILGGGISANTLLRAGYGGPANEVAFGGNTADMLYDINRDKFKVYMDKVVRLNQVGEGAIEQNGAYSFVYTYTFKDLPTALTFDEENGNWPNNFAPFVAVGYCYSDGTAPDAVATKLIHTCYSQLQFEDI